MKKLSINYHLNPECLRSLRIDSDQLVDKLQHKYKIYISKLIEDDDFKKILKEMVRDIRSRKGEKIEPIELHKELMNLIKEMIRMNEFILPELDRCIGSDKLKNMIIGLKGEEEAISYLSWLFLKAYGKLLRDRLNIFLPLNEL